MSNSDTPVQPAPWLLRGAVAVWLVCAVLWWRQAPAPANPPVWPIPEATGAARKAEFINTLLPAIRETNNRILLDRYRAGVLHEQLQRRLPLLPRDRRWLAWQGYYYRLPDTEQPDADWAGLLLRRVDVVPADLALAQGAIESAWGNSRFARKGNNYFGHWCFQPGCGLVPRQRRAGARHEVRVFDSVASSVARYMQNLNSHPAYTRFRRLREQLRESGEPLTGLRLAAGLEDYSALGTTYVQRVRRLIRQNDLGRFRRPHVYR